MFKPSNVVADSDNELTFDSGVTLAVDGDEIVFKVAAACETRSVVAVNTVNGSEGVFPNKTAFKDFLHGLDVPAEHYDLEDRQVAEPLKNAMATLKAKIMNLRAQFNTKNVEIYLGGNDNFRDSIPLPVKYKSNRDGTLRPLLLQELRAYLIEHYDAIVVHGQEADDLLCQRAFDGVKTKNKIIAVTQDKDSFSYTGWIYNPEKDKEPSFCADYGSLFINDKNEVKGRGRIWLQHQVLLGDAADGYKPTDLVKIVKGKVKAFGEKASYKLLSGCTKEVDGWKVVHDQYLEWFGKEPFTYKCWQGVEHTIDYIDALQMYFDCARMRRWDGDTVCIRSVLKNIKVI